MPEVARKPLTLEDVVSEATNRGVMALEREAERKRKMKEERERERCINEQVLLVEGASVLQAWLEDQMGAPVDIGPDHTPRLTFGEVSVLLRGFPFGGPAGNEVMAFYACASCGNEVGGFAYVRSLAEVYELAADPEAKKSLLCKSCSPPPPPPDPDPEPDPAERLLEAIRTFIREERMAL